MGYAGFKTIIITASIGALFFSLPSIFFFEGASLVPLRKRVIEAVQGFAVLFVIISFIVSIALMLGFNKSDVTDQYDQPRVPRWMQ